MDAETPIPQQFNSLPDASSEVPMGAYEAGDIVLPSSTPKKKGRKGLVVAMVILVLGLVGVGVWTYFNFIATNNGSNTNTKASETEIQNAFNEYTNYLFYGEKKNDKIDFEAFFEEYDLYNPSIYGETADFDKIKEANDLYDVFVEKYDATTLSEAQTYFYYYLGCKIDSIDASECVINLGEDYKKLYSPYDDEATATTAIKRILTLREAAMQAIFDTYNDIYHINNMNNSEAIQE